MSHASSSSGSPGSRGAPILVVGGTGNVGSTLVRLLNASGHRPRVMTRDRTRAATILGDAAELVEGDLTDPASLAGGLGGVGRAFFLGSAGPELAHTAEAFASAAHRAGVHHVVAISSGTTEMVPPVALGAWHAAMEQAVTASGIATTYLRPDNFASNALRWAPVIRARSTVFAALADGHSVPIDPYDIAAVAHAALTQPDHEGKVYTLSGPAVMSTREQVAAIAAALGRELAVVDVTIEQAREAMTKSGMPADMAAAIVEVYGHAPRLTRTVEDVTGRPPRSFAAWVAEHRSAFA